MTARDLPEGLIERSWRRADQSRGIITLSQIRTSIEAALAWRDEHGVQWVYHRDEVVPMLADLVRGRGALEAQVEELRRERDRARAERDASIRYGVECEGRLSEHVEAMVEMLEKVTTAQDRFEMDTAMAAWEQRHGRLLAGTKFALLSQESENG